MTTVRDCHLVIKGVIVCTSEKKNLLPPFQRENKEIYKYTNTLQDCTVFYPRQVPKIAN